MAETLGKLVKYANMTAGTQLRAVVTFLAIASFLALPGTAVCAASVDIVVNPPIVYAGSEFSVQVTVRDSSEADVQDFQAEGVRITGKSRSQSISIVNQNVSRSFTVNFQCFAQRTGEITIPPVTVIADGAQLKTPEKKITVADVPQQQFQNNAVNSGQPASPDDLPVMGQPGQRGSNCPYC